VQNSLDAGALQVDIGVDPEAWTCWVRDDGCGIPREGLNLLARGKEKGRYGTSKAYGTAALQPPSTFGFRGEALASAIDLATVEISSRVAEREESWSLVVKGGEKLYAGPALRWRRERPGTIVNIKDAFYNLPVRRLSHLTAVTTLQNIKRDIEKFALMFPHVGFTLEKSAAEREAGELNKRLLTIVKTPDTLSTFAQLFGKALVQACGGHAACTLLTERRIACGDSQRAIWKYYDRRISQSRGVTVEILPISLCEPASRHHLRIA